MPKTLKRANSGHETKHHKIPKNHCFGCGPDNPEGMQLNNAKLGGIFNMGGAAVANYVSVLEPLK